MHRRSTVWTAPERGASPLSRELVLLFFCALMKRVLSIFRRSRENSTYGSAIGGVGIDCMRDIPPCERKSDTSDGPPSRSPRKLVPTPVPLLFIYEFRTGPHLAQYEDSITRIARNEEDGGRFLSLLPPEIFMEVRHVSLFVSSMLLCSHLLHEITRFAVDFNMMRCCY